MVFVLFKNRTNTFSSTETQTNHDLEIHREQYVASQEREQLTYLVKGIKVRDQTMALTPPITSSEEGTEPVDGQIPFST